MGAQPGHEKLHPNRQHLPLLRAFPDGLLQGLQRQAVSEGGRGTHHIQPWARFIKDWTSEKRGDTKGDQRHKSNRNTSRQRPSEGGCRSTQRQKRRNEGWTRWPWRKTAVWKADDRSQEQSVRQQRPTAVQRQGHVWLPGRGLYGLLLPLPRLRLTQVWGRVPLREEVALRAGGGGGRRDHPEQVCCVISCESFKGSWIQGLLGTKTCLLRSCCKSSRWTIQDCEGIFNKVHWYLSGFAKLLHMIEICRTTWVFCWILHVQFIARRTFIPVKLFFVFLYPLVKYFLCANLC